MLYLVFILSLQGNTIDGILCQYILYNNICRFILHLGVREDTATITALFQSVLVTTTTSQTAAVKKILKLDQDSCNNWF